MSKIKYPDLRLEESIVTSTKQIRNSAMDNLQTVKYSQQFRRSNLNASGTLNTGIILRCPILDSFASEVSIKLNKSLQVIREIELTNNFITTDKNADLNRANFTNLLLEDEDDYLEHQGVHHISTQSKVLFSEEIEIEIKELSRWQPRINIERRMLEDEDD